jgi:copper chaperone CopZ
LNDETLTYAVDGMTCDHCRNAVSDEVFNVSGVELVEVDLERKRVVVQGANLKDEAVRAAIDEAGYYAVRAA